MKILIGSLILFYSSFVLAQEITAANYEKVKSLLIHKVLTNTVAADDIKNLNLLAFDFQNRGQRLGESQKDFVAAYKLIDTAILIFSALNDTYSIANNLKFHGFLLGKLGRFAEAKAEITRAIYLFNAIDKSNGVAVSQFDLSRIFEFENKMDSAIHYTLVPLNYWQTKNDSFRIFILQTALVNLYTRTNELDKASLIQKQIEFNANNPNLHWQNLIDFYFVSRQLFKAQKNNILSDRYTDLYNKIVEDLKQKEIVAKSQFDDSQK